MRYVKKVLQKVFPFITPDWKKPKKSYSQCGEDLLIDFVFQQLHLSKISYLDIGANDPVFLNNTYWFYNKGSSGVCVEPNPALFKSVKRKRPRDICLNVGVGVSTQGGIDFHIMDPDTLSTFSKESAEESVKAGYRLKNIVQIPLIPVGDIIERYLGHAPHLVSLDTEGLDLQILQNFDYALYRPVIFCVETIDFLETKKIKPIFDLMEEHDYFVYADTFINTIFVDRALWNKRS
jgi:FkbM family methyltransferase